MIYALQARLAFLDAVERDRIASITHGVVDQLEQWGDGQINEILGKTAAPTLKLTLWFHELAARDAVWDALIADLDPKALDVDAGSWIASHDCYDDEDNRLPCEVDRRVDW